jgi:hypothetical protein
MQRGIIILNQAEMAQLQSRLADQLLPPLLDLKIKNNNLVESNLKIEMSEEDAELLLDTLPIPSSNEDLNLSTLRNSLQSFLQNLRNI